MENLLWTIIVCGGFGIIYLIQQVESVKKEVSDIKSDLEDINSKLDDLDNINYNLNSIIEKIFPNNYDEYGAK